MKKKMAVTMMLMVKMMILSKMVIILVNMLYANSFCSIDSLLTYYSICSEQYG